MFSSSFSIDWLESLSVGVFYCCTRNENVGMLVIMMRHCPEGTRSTNSPFLPPTSEQMGMTGAELRWGWWLPNSAIAGFFRLTLYFTLLPIYGKGDTSLRGLPVLQELDRRLQREILFILTTNKSLLLVQLQSSSQSAANLSPWVHRFLDFVHTGHSLRQHDAWVICEETVKRACLIKPCQQKLYISYLTKHACRFLLTKMLTYYLLLHI